MFCTGGIRCEKSTAYLKEEGFEVDTFVEEKSIVLGYFGTKIPPNKNDKIRRIVVGLC